MANSRKVMKILVQIREWFTVDEGIISVEEVKIHAVASGLGCKWSEEDVVSAVRMLNRERGYNG